MILFHFIYESFKNGAILGYFIINIRISLYVLYDILSNYHQHQKTYP